MHERTFIGRRKQLTIATTGPEPRVIDDVTCLIDGPVFNLDALGRTLGIDPSNAETVVAAGYRRWSDDVVRRLDGEYSLVLWDQRAGSGLVARDRLGVRRLFYSAAGSLTFATDERDLLALLPKRPAPDPVAVVHWLSLRGAPEDTTLWTGVRRLLPAHCMRLEEMPPVPLRYWRLEHRDTTTGDAALAAERLSIAITSAVERRVPSDATAGVLLSGGLDSATVAAPMSRARRGHAYAGTFPRYPLLDESTYIELVARDLGLPLTTLAVEPAGLLASALTFNMTWQVPLVTWGDFWTSPLLAHARDDHIDIVLDGTGGDELFGTREFAVADRLRHLRFMSALRLAGRATGAREHLGRRGLIAAVVRSMGRAALPPALHRRLRGLRTPTRQSPVWLTPASADTVSATVDPWGWTKLDGPRWWAHAAYLLTDGLESLGVFDYFDHAAAGAGVEWSHPLLDVDLIDEVLAIDPELSFDPEWTRPLQRAVLDRWIPNEVSRRAEKPLFNDLIVDALAGPDFSLVRAVLDDPDAAVGPYVDRAAVRSVLLDGQPSDHPVGPFVWAQEVWRLFTAECWLRAEADPDVLPALASRASTFGSWDHPYDA